MRFLRLSTISTSVSLSVGLFLGATPLVTHAQQQTDAFCINQAFYARISQYYNLAVAFAILAAIFMIVYGGYRLVVSIGRPGLIEQGKKMIQNALIGLIIAIVSAVILNILNPRILNQNGEQCGAAPSALHIQTEVLSA
ncbi:MAG: hypothetical protein U0517_03855 [Candidatus Andersenbacteria bacterium]